MDLPSHAAEGLTEDFRNPGVPEELLHAPETPQQSFVARRDVPHADADDVPFDRQSLATMEAQFASSSERFPSPEKIVVPSAGGGAQFVLHEQINRGGHGEIWRATQRSLQREIAVKALVARQADAESDNVRERRRREFIAEAHTAAELEHPNILPVYDLGIDAKTANPMLAMKLIRGENWEHQLFADRGLPIEERIGKHLPIFVAVCNAVAYAHSHDIIHRDLKPAQVIVGAFGEVLLTDWGLAVRASRSGQPSAWDVAGKLVPTMETATNPAGTPSYMAPEQVLRHTKNLGKWTDIYLLGGVLYRILTNSLPHRGEGRAAVLYKASLGVVEPAEDRAPGTVLPPQLVAIAAKALQPDPTDRFGSVLELRIAISDFMSGAASRRESVRLSDEVRELVGDVSSANMETLLRSLGPLERALREWPDNAAADTMLRAARGRLSDIRDSKRQLRFALAGTAMVVVVAFVGLFAWQSRRLLLRAEVQRDRALRAADAMVSELAMGLRPIAGTQARAVLGILDKATSTYDEILAGDEQRVDVLERKAAASVSLGDLYMTLGEGANAAARLKTGADISRRLLVDDPRNPVLLETLCNALLLQSALRNREEVGGSIDGLLDEAKKCSDALAALGDSPGSVVLSARVMSRFGDNFHSTRRAKEGAAAAAKSLELLEAGSKKHPGDPDIKLMLIEQESSMAESAMYGGRVEEMLDRLSRAMEESRRLVAIDASNASWRQIYAMRLAEWGQAISQSERSEEGLAAQRESLAILQELAKLDSTNFVTKLHLAMGLKELGVELTNRGEFEEASGLLVDSLENFDRIITNNPKDTQVLSAMQMAMSSLADAHEKAGDTLEAISLVRRMHAMSDQLIAADPDALQWRYRKSDSGLRLARILRRNNAAPKEELLEILRTSQKIMAELSASSGLTRQQKGSAEMVESEIRELTAGDTPAGETP